LGKRQDYKNEKIYLIGYIYNQVIVTLVPITVLLKINKYSVHFNQYIKSPERKTTHLLRHVLFFLNKKQTAFH